MEFSQTSKYMKKFSNFHQKVRKQETMLWHSRYSCHLWHWHISDTWAQVQDSAALLQIYFPINGLAPVSEFLPPTWETWRKPRVPGFGLTQHWPLWPFVEWNSTWKISVSLTKFTLSNKSLKIKKFKNLGFFFFPLRLCVCFLSPQSGDWFCRWLFYYPALFT